MSRPFIRSEARNRRWPPISLAVMVLTASGTASGGESRPAPAAPVDDRQA